MDKWDNSNGKQHPAWMMIAMKDLARADDETLKYVASHKQELIDMPLNKFMLSEDAQKLIKEKGSINVAAGYTFMRNMALVFDMFMALAED